MSSEALTDACANAPFLLVVTGAGVSLASGIPTFRGTDPDAVWAHDVVDTPACAPSSAGSSTSSTSASASGSRTS